MDKKDVYVMSMQEAEEFASKEHPYTSAVISITSRRGLDATVASTSINGIRGLLVVKCDDVNTETEGGLESEQAYQIAKFVNYVKDILEVDMLIVHCEEGRSRSVGVAAAILKYFWSDESILSNKEYTPNMLCYKKVLNALIEMNGVKHIKDKTDEVEEESIHVQINEMYKEYMDLAYKSFNIANKIGIPTDNESRDLLRKLVNSFDTCMIPINERLESIRKWSNMSDEDLLYYKSIANGTRKQK